MQVFFFFLPVDHLKSAFPPIESAGKPRFPLELHSSRYIVLEVVRTIVCLIVVWRRKPQVYSDGMR